MSELVPLGSNVVCERIKPKDKLTEGGLIIETNEKDAEKFFAKVIAVGPGRYESGTWVPNKLKVGDIVLWGSSSGFFRLGSKEIMIAKEENMQALVTDYEYDEVVVEDD